MRVLYILPTLDHVAPIEVMSGIILRGEAKERSVIALHKSGQNSLMAKLRENDVEVQEFASFKEAVLNFSALLEKAKEYQIIHASGFIPTLFAALLKLFHPHARYIVTVHSNEPQEFLARDFSGMKRCKNRFRLWLLRRVLYRRFDLCVGVSHAVQKYLQNCGCKESVTIHNGINYPPKSVSQEPKEPLTFVQVGHIERLKNQLFTLRLASYLSNEGARFIFCGAIKDKSYFEELHTFIKEHHLQNSVEFRGLLAKDELFHVLAKSRFFIMPSHSEGLPLSLLEALHFDAIPLCSNVGGMVDVAIKTKSGLLFDLSDAEAFVKIEAFIKSAPPRGNCGEILQREFGADAMAEQYHRLYRELLA